MSRHRSWILNCLSMLLLLAAPMLLWARTPWIEKVPPHDHGRTDPAFGSPDATAAGERLFADHCAECHGKDAMGKGRHPSLRSERVQNDATPGDMHWLLVNGNLGRGMPSWSKLPDQQLWQIISFVKSLKPQTR
jgi:mono/diheme cytochrome c family protein